MTFRDGGAAGVDDTNRLVYRIRDQQIEIAQCRTHYE
ncbi:type II toxin-antitoxin system YoeB family toxin [Sporolactobacillus vineae]